MATLIAAELARISRWMMRDPNLGSCSFTKVDLAAAVTAADSWADSNAASFNTALPSAFRTTATLQQKALLLMYVIARRAGARPIDGED